MRANLQPARDSDPHVQVFCFSQALGQSSGRRQICEVNEMSDWESSENDVRWLKATVSSLQVGGFWVAPMGFIFEKATENELVLVAMEDKPEVKDTLRRTIKVGKKAGIKITVPRKFAV